MLKLCTILWNHVFPKIDFLIVDAPWYPRRGRSEEGNPCFFTYPFIFWRFFFFFVCCCYITKVMFIADDCNHKLTKKIVSFIFVFVEHFFFFYYFLINNKPGGFLNISRNNKFWCPKLPNIYFLSFSNIAWRFQVPIMS